MSLQEIITPDRRRFVRSRAALWLVALLVVLALGGGLSVRGAQAATTPAPAFTSTSVPQAVVPAPNAVPQTATIRDQTGLPDTCLAVTKTVDKTTANIGDTLTYKLTVTNNTNPGGALGGFPCSLAINPSLDDKADNNVSFKSGTLTVAPASGMACSLSSGDVNCTTGQLQTTDTVVITFQATITGCGSTSNYATFTAANFITMIPPFFFTQTGTSNGVVTTINCPDLVLTKTLAPDTNVPALIGGTVHYQIVVKNQGLAPAQGVTVTDPVPAGYKFASAVIGTATPAPNNAFSPCHYGSTDDLPGPAPADNDGDGSNGAICGGLTPSNSSLNTLGPGQAVTVDLYLTVTGCQLGPNTATVTSTTSESDASGLDKNGNPIDANNSATAPAPAVKCPNLVPSKTALGANGAPLTTLPSGGTFTYSIAVQNTGNAAVQPHSPADPLEQSVVIHDQLPANLQLVSGPAGKVPADWDCKNSSGTFINCEWIGPGAGGVGGLDLNQTTTPLQVTVQTPSLNPGQAPLTICNYAAVNGDVTLAGPGKPDSDIVVITTPSGAVVWFDPADKPVPETSYTDNVAQSCVTVTPPNAAPEPIPTLTKTADKTSAATGDLVTYTLTVGNTAGNQDMTNVQVADQLADNVSLKTPPGITCNGAPCDGKAAGAGFTCVVQKLSDIHTNNLALYNTLPPALAANATAAQIAARDKKLAAQGSNVIVCSGGTVKAGSSVAISFVVEIESCPDVTNQAVISHYEDRDDDAQDADDAPVYSNTVTVTVTSCPKLTINKQGPSTVPNTSSLVAYVVTVQNTGTVGATNVTLKDVIGPAANIGTFWSISPVNTSSPQAPGVPNCSAPVLSGGNDVITCNMGNIAPNGGTATLNLLVQLSGGSFCSITNTATATGALNGVTVTAVPTPTATSNTVVTTTPCPDVSIVKTFDHSDSGTGFGATGIVPDTHAIWHIVVTNNSTTVQALGTEVKDVFDRPSDFATLAASVSPTSAGACTTSLVSNETANKPNTLTNVDCLLGTLAPGASVTITVDALTKSAPAFCAVSDTATVTTTNGNLNAATTSTAGPTPVLCTSLSLTKKVTLVNGAAPLTQGTPPVATVRPGDTVTYEIDVTNPSTSTVSNLNVKDAAPAGLSFVPGSVVVGGAFAGLNCATTTAANLDCKNGTLPGGTTGTVTFNATVLATRGSDTPVPNCGPITNTATTHGTNIFLQKDIDAKGSVDILVLCPDLQTKKALADGNGHVITPPVAIAGTNAPYHYLITVVNNGTLATPVTVTDVLPAGEDVNCPSLPIGSCLPGPFSSTSPYGTWSCTVAGVPPAQETVTCTLSGGLPQGGVVVLDIPISFGGPSRTDINCADVTVPAGTVLTSDSVTHACVTVEVHSNDFHPDVQITKACTDTTPPPGPAALAPASINANFGDTVTCTLTVANHGNAPAELVTVTDVTPTKLTFAPGPGNPTSTGGTQALDCSGSTAAQVSCVNGKLASQGNPGDTAIITVTYTVNGCGAITNTATTTAQADLGTTNKSSSFTINAQCAKLAVTKGNPHTGVGPTAAPVTFIDTSNGPTDVIYDITVSNSNAAGTGHTVGLKVTDTLPTGGTYDASTTTLPAGWSCSANAATPQTVTCTTTPAAQLAAGGSAVLHIEVTYAYPTSCPTSVTNNATASDASGATATSSPGSTLPVFCADIAVAAGPGSTIGGSTAGSFNQNYSVTETGAPGTAAATNVKLHMTWTESSGLVGTLTSVTATNGGVCTFSSTATTMTADCTWTSIPQGQMNGVTASGFYTNVNHCTATFNGTASTDPANGGAEPNVHPDADDTTIAAINVGSLGNLITNCSFESPAIPSGTASGFSTISGWTAVNRPAPFTQTCPTQIELDNNAFMPAAAGNQSEELNANCASAIRQTVPTTNGQTYTLRFAYAARPGTLATDNIVCVYWNAVQVGCTAATTNTNWTYATFTVVGSPGSSTQLIFSSGDTVAPASSVGSEIDDVSLF